MKRIVILAEYDMPLQHRARNAGLWFIGLAAIAILIGAGMALMNATQTESQVQVPISK